LHVIILVTRIHQLGDERVYLWGKRTAAALLAGSLLAGGLAQTATAAPKPVTVLLDDIAMTFDGTNAEISNNVTFVPFRSIGEAMGIDIKWKETTKTITAVNDVNGAKKTVVLQVGKVNATVNGKTFKLAAAPYMKNGRTLIPLSFFSTQFGAQVGWNGTTRTVSIVSPVRKMHLRGFYAISAFSERARIDDMNSVAFGWLRVDSNGEIITNGKDYYWPKPAGDVTPESIIRDTAAKGIDPYLMVYSVDGNLELTKMLSDPTLRDRSIDNIAAKAKDNGFSGILLDYEGLGHSLDPVEQQKLLNDYVRLLVKKLDGIKLSLAVHPPNSAYKGYDYRTLAQLADDLVIMSYQYHPVGTAVHTPQPNKQVEDSIAMLIKAGIPKEKLLLGIDIWSETPQSVDDKLGLAKRYGLKGASFWRIGLYSFYGQPMIDAINRSAVKLGN
jgi:hypothetical protein